ncbi:MAG: hypothetical protein QGF09_09600, partial [Rhodospirillales bacterium]|nr:hypothetical protein [Rhodospirillales bacterium]
MFRQSEIIGNYFTRVTGAEKELFGAPHFLPGNVRQLAFTRDDLSSLDGSVLGSALDADFIVVFGASYIKGELCAKLV